MVVAADFMAVIQGRVADIESRFPAPAGGFRAALQVASAAPGPVEMTSPTPHQPTATSAAPAGDWARRLPPEGQKWAGAIESAAKEAGIDPRLLAGLVRAESGFRADARSHAGATGLAQLMPGTARELGVDPTDPIANLRGGARYLRQQLDRFGSHELALAAYNAGPGRVAQAGGIPRITETQNYVTRVLGYVRELGGSQ